MKTTPQLTKLSSADFCRQLEAERARLGYSKADVARYLGLSYRVVWQWLSEKSGTTACAQQGALRALADAPVKPGFMAKAKA